MVPPRAAAGPSTPDNMRMEGFTPAELGRLRALKTPIGIQRFLDAMPYPLATTAWSPRRVLRERTAHCLEGAIFAAAALRAIGRPPLIIDLEGERDSDHVLAVYKERDHCGTVAISHFSGLGHRVPVSPTRRAPPLGYSYDAFNT